MAGGKAQKPMQSRFQRLSAIAAFATIVSACGLAGESDNAALDAEALAFALEATHNQSFAYEQGTTILFGSDEIDMADNTPPTDSGNVIGFVDDGAYFVSADIGASYAAAFEPLGIGEPTQFEGLRTNMWIVDNTMFADLSDAAELSRRPVIDPDSEGAPPIAMLDSGPISVDLERLDVLTDTEIDRPQLLTLMSHVSVIDPLAMLEVVEVTNGLEQTGTNLVSGYRVTEYSASISFLAYRVAAGDPPAEGFDWEAVAQEPAEADIRLIVALDDEGLIRQVTVEIAADINGISTRSDTWQTFQDYGADFDVDPPEGAEATDEVAELLLSLGGT